MIDNELDEDFIVESDILYIDVRESKILFKMIPFMYSKKIPIKAIHITEKMNLSGDYYYKCDKGELLIERKDMPDLDGSISKENVFSQSQKMVLWVQSKSYRYAAIKTIGDNSLMNPNANISYKNRIGAMESVQWGTGVPVNNYSTDDAFIWSIYKNIRSLKEGKFGKFRTLDLFKYEFPDINLKLSGTRIIHINVLRCYGASKKQATAIVDKYFISAWNDLGIFEDIADLTDIEGIGPKTADKILNRMGIIPEEI